MRTGGIAQSYLDPLAVRIQSVRMGARGRGWRRFLVFAELTKSKKGSEYVALFTYYNFEGKTLQHSLVYQAANVLQLGYALSLPKGLELLSMPLHSIRS